MTSTPALRQRAGRRRFRRQPPPVPKWIQFAAILLCFLQSDMTNPLGQNERVEYQENLSTSLVGASESSAPSASGLTIDNTNLN